MSEQREDGVRRYTLDFNDHGMDNTGEFVLASDYDFLAAQLADAQAKLVEADMELANEKLVSEHYAESCNVIREQREAAEARIRELERYEYIEAQHVETGRLWFGPRYRMPPGYAEISNESGVVVELSPAPRTDCYNTPLPPISESDGAIYGAHSRATAQQPETWRHKEKGGTYTVVGHHAQMKIDDAWLPAVVYRDAAGHHYTRVAAAFARNFERIAQQPAEGARDE